MTFRLPSAEMLPAGLREQAKAQLAGRQPNRTGVKAPRSDDEHHEQVEFFRRIRLFAQNGQRYALAATRTYAIPNGGGRTKREAGRLKAEGVRPGVSDIFVSLPSGPNAGLYIEMKSQTGRMSAEQRAWIDESARLGYAAACCHGADEALQVWIAYIDGATEKANGTKKR